MRYKGWGALLPKPPDAPGARVPQTTPQSRYVRKTSHKRPAIPQGSFITRACDEQFSTNYWKGDATPCTDALVPRRCQGHNTKSAKATPPSRVTCDCPLPLHASGEACPSFGGAVHSSHAQCPWAASRQGAGMREARLSPVAWPMGLPPTLMASHLEHRARAR